MIGRALLVLAAMSAWALETHPAQPSNCSKERKVEIGEASAFTLTFRSLADLVSPGLHAYTTVTRVDGASCRASMVLTRHGGDLVNRPVGLFSTTLSRQDAQAIAAAADRIQWNSLPVPTKGDISAAVLELEYRKGTQDLRRTFSASNLELLHALGPVMQQLDRLGGTLLSRPDRAITVTGARTAAGFKLTIRNIGAGPVMIANPTLAGATPNSTRGSVGVAKAPDRSGGFQPIPVLTPVSLKPGGSSPIVIAAGQSMEFETVPWNTPGPGAYIAKATWMDYEGPKVDAADAMPAFPDPAAVAHDRRPYPIRGAAFSGWLQFNVE